MKKWKWNITWKTRSLRTDRPTDGRRACSKPVRKVTGAAMLYFKHCYGRKGRKVQQSMTLVHTRILSKTVERPKHLICVDADLCQMSEDLNKNAKAHSKTSNVAGLVSFTEAAPRDYSKTYSDMMQQCGTGRERENGREGLNNSQDHVHTTHKLTVWHRKKG